MKANVLGFGTMGRQISALLLVMGYEVTVWTRQMSEDKISKFSFERRFFSRKFGKNITKAEVTYVDRPTHMPPALTIEALAEKTSVKSEVIASLTYSPDDVDFFTNTSSICPNEIHPAIMGLHFFNPISSMRLIEASYSTQKIRENGSLLLKNLQSVGMSIVPVHSNRGYVGNSILFQEISAALKLVDRYQYSTTTIDQIMKGIGRETSLFEIIDLVGVDVVLNILENLHQIDPGIYVSPSLNLAVEKNILGKKNGSSIRDLIDIHQQVPTSTTCSLPPKQH